jgi:2-polyprenyl-3-methyl-5-hydroxy-6-metoxy-1,4-benzoquinol methylase
MAKKMKFESFKFRFLVAARQAAYHKQNMSGISWKDFVNSLEFDYQGGAVVITWKALISGILTVNIEEARFYLRGDTEKQSAHQREIGLTDTEDPIKLKNDKYFKEVVMRVAESAEFQKSNTTISNHDQRIEIERQFHDDWANSAQVEKIDVRASNEVCTAPEMRYITKRLGNLKGKRLLDVGCGLGEASVYFALLGADVTASDLSQGMLDATSRLAEANGVYIKQHIASAEDLQLSPDSKFDIIYAGNLLHHVNIESTIMRISSHLIPDGFFVSWDPLAYNPMINVYRSIATQVRTPDEHPLRWSDIKIFKKYFREVETRYFWLTTLVIFLIMALAQRRNPNKERFWKVVVLEGKRWAWLYKPLEVFDRILLNMIPPLRLLCWNVVIVAKA